MKHLELLENAFCEVLKKMAFMFSEPAVKEELETSEAVYLKAAMEFNGDFHGKIAIVVPEALGREVTANILGQEPEDDKAKSYTADALKELLNVTCGRVLTALAGEEPRFNLSIPEITSLNADGWREQLTETGVAAFRVEDYPMLLAFACEGEK